MLGHSHSLCFWSQIKLARWSSECPVLVTKSYCSLSFSWWYFCKSCGWHVWLNLEGSLAFCEKRGGVQTVVFLWCSQAVKMCCPESDSRRGMLEELDLCRDIVAASWVNKSLKEKSALIEEESPSYFPWDGIKVVSSFSLWRRKIRPSKSQRKLRKRSVHKLTGGEDRK